MKYSAHAQTSLRQGKLAFCFPPLNSLNAEQKRCHLTSIIGYNTVSITILM